MNKRHFSTISLAVLSLSLCLVLAPLAEAARSIPPEVKSYTIKFMNEFSAAMHTLASSVEKTGDPVQIAGALNSYTDTIEPLMKGMADLEKKYPEFFKEVKEDDSYIGADPEMAKAEAEFSKTQGMIMSTIMKIVPHMEHPQVQAAMERMEKIMQIMADK